MKQWKLAALLLAVAVLLVGCMPSSAGVLEPEEITFLQFEPVKSGQEIAVIHTTEGDITMMLFGEQAPNTVAHFKKLVEEGFYNDLPLFPQAGPHTFVTGASTESGMAGKIATEDGKPLAQEVTPNLWHFRGAVSVYGYTKNRFSNTVYADSRFFIVGGVGANSDMVSQMEEYGYPQKVINAYKEHGGLPQYTGVYTVFGQVIDGLDVVDRLSALPYNEETGQAEDARIESITLGTYGEPAK